MCVCVCVCLCVCVAITYHGCTTTNNNFSRVVAIFLVDRYKEFADAVTFCAKLGNYSKEDELIVKRKAKAIVNCFLDSQIPPKLQVSLLHRFQASA